MKHDGQRWMMMSLAAPANDLQKIVLFTSLYHSYQIQEGSDCTGNLKIKRIDAPFLIKTKASKRSQYYEVFKA